MLLGVVTPGVMADAIFTYEPANLMIGEKTEVTVSLSATPDDDFGIALMSFLFAPPPELTILDFDWLGKLADPLAYFSIESVVSPQTFLISGDFLTVPSKPAKVEIYTISVFVSESASLGQILELPSGPQISDLGFSPISSTFENEKIEDLTKGPIENLTFRAVPEPATLALLIVGGLWTFRRRR